MDSPKLYKPYFLLSLLNKAIIDNITVSNGKGYAIVSMELVNKLKLRKAKLIKLNNTDTKPIE